MASTFSATYFARKHDEHVLSHTQQDVSPHHHKRMRAGKCPPLGASRPLSTLSHHHHLHPPIFRGTSPHCTGHDGVRATHTSATMMTGGTLLTLIAGSVACLFLPRGLQEETVCDSPGLVVSRSLTPHTDRAHRLLVHCAGYSPRTPSRACSW